MSKTKINRHGVVLLNKPRGLTSNSALQKVKWLLSAKKAGHTGSLDPLATGLLPLCFGEATKFASYMLAADKHYRVTAELGRATSTGDAEGSDIEVAAIPSDFAERLPEVVQHFIGEIQQIPPMFSALKQNGVPLYELARQGIEVPREPRNIRIFRCELLATTANTMTFQVHCSKGTYIRTLMEDIAKALGTVAHVTDLHRNQVGHFAEKDMFSIETIEQRVADDAVDTVIIPIEMAFGAMPAIELSAAAYLRVRHGNPITTEQSDSAGPVRLYSPAAQFLGIGEIQNNTLQPKRLIADSLR